MPSSQNIASLAVIPNLESLTESFHELTPGSLPKKEELKVQRSSSFKLVALKKKENSETQNNSTPKQYSTKSLVFSKTRGLSFVDQSLETKEDTYRTPRAKVQDFNSPKTSRFTTPSLNFEGMNRLWERNVKQYYDITRRNRTQSVGQIDSGFNSQRNTLMISSFFKHQETVQKKQTNIKTLHSQFYSCIQSRKSSQGNVRPSTQAVPLVQYITIGQIKENKENIEQADILKEGVSKRLGIKKVLQKTPGCFLTVKKHPTFIRLQKKKKELTISSLKGPEVPQATNGMNLTIQGGSNHMWKLTPRHSKMVIETPRPQSKAEKYVPGKRSLSIAGLSKVLL